MQAVGKPARVRFSAAQAPPGNLPLDPAADQLLTAAARAAGDPSGVLAVVRRMSTVPRNGGGNTRRLWELLASVAALDLASARALEPHVDAAGILAEAEAEAEADALPSAGGRSGRAWGVFAAEGSSHRLEASPASGGGWVLTGSKPWCSLAAELDAAVVTAHVTGGRRAFAVDLRQAGVVPQTDGWDAHGLPGIPSLPVIFDAVPAQPAGGTGWYLRRPGFAWGGIGVAACWFGGGVGVYRTLREAAGRRQPDQLALAALGEADRLLASAAAMLSSAADSVDAAAAGTGPDVGWLMAHRVRGHVADVCARIMDLSDASLGPGPLAFDADHARRMADLKLYVRQHHGGRDDAALGAAVLEAAAAEAAEGEAAGAEGTARQGATVDQEDTW